MAISKLLGTFIPITTGKPLEITALISSVLLTLNISSGLSATAAVKVLPQNRVDSNCTVELLRMDENPIFYHIHYGAP
ncbi:MAG: hypothetical protein IPN86_18675 [Saprospiraceae bacterium]|nr:hypothetical protein [Saprospiraceae bacterium]